MLTTFIHRLAAKRSLREQLRSTFTVMGSTGNVIGPGVSAGTSVVHPVTGLSFKDGKIFSLPETHIASYDTAILSREHVSQCLARALSPRRSVTRKATLAAMSVLGLFFVASVIEGVNRSRGSTSVSQSGMPTVPLKSSGLPSLAPDNHNRPQTPQAQATAIPSEALAALRR